MNKEIQYIVCICVIEIQFCQITTNIKTHVHIYTHAQGHIYVYYFGFAG